MSTTTRPNEAKRDESLPTLVFAAKRELVDSDLAGQQAWALAAAGFEAAIGVKGLSAADRSRLLRCRRLCLRQADLPHLGIKAATGAEVTA